MGAAPPRNRFDRACAARRWSAIPDRSASRLAARSHRLRAARHAETAVRGAGRAWHAGVAECGLALAAQERDDAQKKTFGPRSRAALTSRASGGPGSAGWAGSTRRAWCFWTKHGSRRTWPRCTAGGRAGGGCGAMRLMAIGARRPSSPPCAKTPSPHPAFSTARSTAAPSSPGSSACSCPHSGPVTWSCSTISARTREPPCAGPSRPPARLWFPPPYSPDLNPIEQAFSKVKHWLREAQARTSEDLIDRLRQITDRFPPRECANYLAIIGYGSKRT